MRDGTEQSALQLALHWLVRAFKADPQIVRTWATLDPLARHVDVAAIHAYKAPVSRIGPGAACLRTASACDGVSFTAVQESLFGVWASRRAERLFAAASQLARRESEPPSRDFQLAIVRLTRGMAATFAGDWPTAQILCDEAEAEFRSASSDPRRSELRVTTARFFSSMARVFLGEWGELAQRLPGQIQEARERDDLYGESMLTLICQTNVRLAANEPGRARDELRQIMDHWSHQGFHIQHIAPWAASPGTPGTAPTGPMVGSSIWNGTA